MPDKPVSRLNLLPNDYLRWGLRTFAGGIMAGGGQGMRLTAALSVSGLVVVAAYFALKVIEHQMDHLQDRAWDGLILDK